ncbi:MAG: DUF3352 domain-containing protein [Planctomycetaceae bacterium]|nr:DUF3352 domain-containing protein [Planctomycetaceae bacterium]
MKKSLSCWSAVLAIVLLITAGLCRSALGQSKPAERPSAPRLLPEKTLAYLRITDTPTLVERFRETSLGRIVKDEQVRPLVQQLYGSVENAWKQIEERVGLPLNELLKIPQGEICVAFVAPPEQQPGLVVLLDVKQQMPAFYKLLGRGEEFLTGRGGSKSEEKLGGQPVSVYTGAGGNTVYLHERDGTILVASSKLLMEYTLKTWAGEAVTKGVADKTLADNSSFNSIMSRCAGTVDDPPQATYFVDPIELVRSLTRGGIGAPGLALIPVLGLDGVKGVGGSITFSTGEFDDVQHMHILLDNPRAGVVELLAMKSADVTPESWIPPDVITYNSFNWDFQLTFDKAASLYNSLTSENEFQMEVQRRISERLGVDFEKDVLPAMEGRVTFAQWVEKPVRINSITTLIGIKLKDAKAFEPLMQKVFDKYADRFEKKSYAGTAYWSVKLPEGRRGRGVGRGPFGTRFRVEGQPPADGQPQEGPALRQPDPCIALVGDYLVGSDSFAALEAAINAHNDPSRRLAGELDYKLIASKIKRQIGGDAPGFVQFARPEEGLRFWYEMAQAEDTRRMLARGAENNSLLKEVDQALKDNPLPPFSVLAKYLAPSGAMMVSDETGYHYMSFTLKRED